MLNDDSCYLAHGLVTLAEALQLEGATTAAWSANPLVVPEKNFDQGFELFDSRNEFRKSELLEGEIDAFLERMGNQRFFLYLHLTDPHDPQAPSSRRGRDRPGRPGRARAQARRAELGLPARRGPTRREDRHRAAAAAPRAGGAPAPLRRLRAHRRPRPGARPRRARAARPDRPHGGRLHRRPRRGALRSRPDPAREQPVPGVHARAPGPRRSGRPRRAARGGPGLEPAPGAGARQLARPACPWRPARSTSSASQPRGHDRARRRLLHGPRLVEQPQRQPIYGLRSGVGCCWAPRVCPGA